MKRFSVPALIAALTLSVAQPALAERVIHADQTGGTVQQAVTSSRDNDNGRFIRTADEKAEKPAEPENCTRVWANTQTHVYHVPGSFWFGATSHGALMCEQTAREAGYRRGAF